MKSTGINVANVENISDEKNTNNIKINDDLHVKKKRSIVILGDSTLKDIEQRKVKNGLSNNEKVYVKHFSGASVN